MCIAMEKERPNDACCGCRLEGYGCPAIYEDNSHVDFADVEKNVAAWAAENPEPVYPTWAEWLNSTGLTKHETGQFCVHMPNHYSYEVKEVDTLNEVAYKPIPADIAQKFGIEPKEGT